MNHLVSVIVPNYNYARFLPQRIESILNQSYPNIELIILDDNSTDNSKAIIEQYRSDKRVKHIVYNEKNSGSTFIQWDKGFKLSSGEFIWIAECDDYADHHFLEKIVFHMIKDKGIKIGFSNSYWVTPGNTFINKDYTINQNKQIYTGKSFVRHHLLTSNYIYNASMAVFRKDALATVNPEYKKYKSCGDKLFWSSIAQTGKVLFVCEPLNYFRIHDTKVTTHSIANGILFKEEYDLYLKNIQNGYINLLNRRKIAKYFVKYINHVKQDFITNDIYRDCLLLWQKEIDSKNKELPLLYRLYCLLHKNK